DAFTTPKGHRSGASGSACVFRSLAGGGRPIRALAQTPEAIRAQIVEGQLRKWFEEVCLLDQPFRDGDENVGQLITNAIATIGENIRVRRFVRYALGEEL
ncbi:MAG: hypothetical protein ACKOPF_02205, partial [Candidatus Limnocylindrus sp.]